MKFEIKSKERGSKEFYDELFYVNNKHDDFLRNPKKKIYRITSICIYGCITSLILLGIFIVSSISNTTFVNLFCAGLSLIMFMIMIASYFRYKKAINTFLNSGGESIFEMDKDGVKMNRIIDGSLSNREVKWKNIKHIIISKNSVIFINDDNMNPLFSIDIKHKEKIVEGLKQLKKDNLIVE